MIRVYTCMGESEDVGAATAVEMSVEDTEPNTGRIEQMEAQIKNLTMYVGALTQHLVKEGLLTEQELCVLMPAGAVVLESD